MNKKILQLGVLLSLLGQATYALGGCLSETQIPSSTPDSQLVANNNGTVMDTKTRLMWKQCVEGLSGSDCSTGTATEHDWQAALVLAEGATDAGYSDWRLPNIKELRSLVEERCTNPAINSTRFPNTPSSDFWSASPNAYYSGYAWYVYFGGGYSNDDNRASGKHVRLVRSGQ